MKTMYHNISQYSTKILQYIAIHFSCMMTPLEGGGGSQYPPEVAQRQAFLEIWHCIEARLITQRENNEQVS